MTNVKAIQMGTHFICGPMNENANVLELSERYQESESKLNSFGLLTYNPLSYHPKMDNDEASQKKFFALQVSCLALCSTVVTIPGWEDCRYANKLVSIAHIMAKEVLPYSKLALNSEIL